MGAELTGRLRVAHLDHSVEPGGAELALLRLVEASSELWSPTLVVPATETYGVFGGLRPNIVQSGPAQPAGITKTASPLAAAHFGKLLWQQVRSLRRQRAFGRVDVIHANSTRAGLYGALAFAGRMPIVLHLRDMPTRESLGVAGFEAYTRLALPRADGVIANSATTMKLAEPFLRRDAQRVVIPSPIGIDRVASPPQLNNRVLNVGMVARLAEWKGQDVLLRAFAAVFRGTATHLHLYGSSALENESYAALLRELSIELGIAEQVTFHGHVDDVAPSIAGLDVCVHASIRPEPLGQNVLQYLALGRPIIAANAGGPAELLQDGVNGLLTEPGSVHELSHALTRLRDQPALRRRISAGAVEQWRLSDGDIAEAHYSFFRAVANRGKGGAS